MLVTCLVLLGLSCLIYQRILTQFLKLVFIKNFGFMELPVEFLFSLFMSNQLFWVILYEKSLYECTVDSDVPQGYIRGPTILLLHVNDLPDDDISDIAIYLC